MSNKSINLKHILFFCAETFPTPYAFLQKVFNEYLLRYGFRFVWIMPSINITKIVKIEWNENPVFLIPKIRPNGIKDLIGAYWQHLQYLREASRLALENYGPFHLLQVRDDPAMAYLAWRLAKKLKIPFVYQISHLKEEEVMMYSHLGIYGSSLKNKIHGKVGLTLRNFFLCKADLIFPISDQMRETLASYGISSERMITLPEGVDTSIDPETLNEEAHVLRKKLSLQAKKVIIYVGTMNRFRQLDFLLEAFKVLLQYHQDVHLLMVGTGKVPGDLDWLKEKATELDIKCKVTFTGFVPREKAHAYIRTSDVGVSPIPPNKVFMNSSPVKLLEYLALEVPVVASDIPEQRKVIKESGSGICVPWNVEKFASGMNKLLSLTAKERRAMGKRGRIWVQRYRDFAILAEKVYNIEAVLPHQKY